MNTNVADMQRYLDKWHNDKEISFGRLQVEVDEEFEE